ncbi:MAG: class I SAM-dependent methyltransferase [Hyphomonadaceae bacterium]|nr:class I SAM-dependent methyltransferase [Hyphomonadaceae bacterium]
MALLFDVAGRVSDPAKLRILQGLTMASNPERASSVEGAGRATASGLCLRVVATAGFADYALLDCGDGRKLERFGRFTVERPEPQALWRPVLEPGQWLRADATFKSTAAEEDGEGGRWRQNNPLPDMWPVRVLGVTALCRLTAFRHLGLFPEQLPHWQWMLEWLRGVRDKPARVLNLFAYTGAASLLAAGAGAEVTHVDASKKAIAWAKQNQAASKLGAAPIRWILDDARKFAAREVRRGKSYHLILIDPPKFGRGPEGEVWDVFTHLAPLLRDCAMLLAPGPAALVLTTYAIRASALATDGLVRECLAQRRGACESGELAVIEQAGGRLLPTSLFTRWTSDDATH